MQMLAVAAILPSLILLSGTRAYPAVRIAGAASAAIASLGWIVERILDVQTPVDAVVNEMAAHTRAIAVTLFLASLACRHLPGSHTKLRERAEMPAEPSIKTLR